MGAEEEISTLIEGARCVTSRYHGHVECDRCDYMRPAMKTDVCQSTGIGGHEVQPPTRRSALCSSV